MLRVADIAIEKTLEIGLLAAIKKFIKIFVAHQVGT
jgi:hypothetical protein